jgi:hypothetical protein
MVQEKELKEPDRVVPDDLKLIDKKKNLERTASNEEGENRPRG